MPFACPACSYSNKDDALVCNLCRAVLRAAPRETPRPGLRHLLQPVGAPPRVLEPGRALTIGRAPDAGLVVDSNRVSRYHAEVRWEQGAPVLVDRGSANGTFVNGERITVAPLRHGDELEIGPFFCRYALQDAAAPRTAVTPRAGGDNTQVVLGGGALEGNIGEMSLAEVLQSIELNEKTGTLEVHGPEGKGWIALQDGHPLAASFAGREGDDAAIALILLTTGRFSFESTLQVFERRMRTTVTGLLLEAGRVRDERVVQDELAAAAAAAAALQRRQATQAAPMVLGEETRFSAAPRGAATTASSDELLARAASVATRAIKRIDRFYLLMTAAAWNAAKVAGRVEHPSGALRMASGGQLVRMANRFHRGQGPLVVLVVDPRLATGAVRWEDAGDGQRVPTLQGSLPVSAVLETQPLHPGPDGAFGTPDWLLNG